jgi:peptidoglycan/xylan/chitin deacetylase (PgdA/CDA1 family)
MVSFGVFANEHAVVLMYHTITEKKTDMNTTPENFQKEMKFLHENKYNVISILELVNAIKNKKELPDKTVVITFDDGWVSQLNAMDKLSIYKYPASFSLITNFLAQKNKNYLQKEDFEKYKSEHFVYINHSTTHAPRDFLDNPAIDVKKSKEEMIKSTGRFIPVYAYPYGMKSRELINELKKNGYEAALGVGEEPVNIKNGNLFNINRYNINDVHVDMVRFKKILTF